MPKRCGHIILSIRLHVLIKNQFKKIFKSKKSKNFGFFWIWFLDILDFWIKFWIWFLDILDFWIWIWIWISKSKTKSKIQNFLDSGVWPYTLSSNPCQSVRSCPKILKICQITKFDMGFQKINMRSRSEKVDFFDLEVFSRTCT